MKISRTVLYVVSLTHFSNDGSTSLLSTLFPVLNSIYSISGLHIGMLIAAGLLTNLIFQPLTGRYVVRFGSRNLMAIGIAFIAISMILFIMSTGFLGILFSVLILRFGSSFFHPVGVSTVSKVYAGEKLDRYMGIQSSFGNLGIFLVFVVSAPLYLTLGWYAPFIVFLFIDLVTLVCIMLAVSNQTEKPARNSVAADPDHEKSSFGLPVFFILSALIVGGTTSAIVNFGNILLVSDRYGLLVSDELISGWLASAFFGAISTGYLTRFAGRHRILIVSYLIAAISILAFILMSADIVIASTTLIINGFFDAILYPSIYSELASFIGSNERIRGTSFGLLFSAQIAGSAAMGLIGGYLVDYAGLLLLFVALSILLFGGIPLTLYWHRKIGRKSQVSA